MLAAIHCHPARAAVDCTAPADLCAMVEASAGIFARALPAEIEPGLRLETVRREDVTLVIGLNAAADRAAPDATALAAYACADPGLRAVIIAGGAVAFRTGERDIGTISVCPEDF
ncbi:MAG: hypothetical protein N2422_03120 [Rhodobacteraceae bacterium]|nr:hypothetical protein [Paracoccaceae bacterium]